MLEKIRALTRQKIAAQDAEHLARAREDLAREFSQDRIEEAVQKAAKNGEGSALLMRWFTRDERVAKKIRAEAQAKVREHLGSGWVVQHEKLYDSWSGFRGYGIRVSW